jgi:hypothetical protein
MNFGCFETGLFGVWASWHRLNWILGFLKLAKLECIRFECRHFEFWLFWFRVCWRWPNWVFWITLLGVLTLAGLECARIYQFFLPVTNSYHLTPSYVIWKIYAIFKKFNSFMWTPSNISIIILLCFGVYSLCGSDNQMCLVGTVQRIVIV